MARRPALESGHEARFPPPGVVAYISNPRLPRVGIRCLFHRICGGDQNVLIQEVAKNVAASVDEGHLHLFPLPTEGPVLSAALGTRPLRVASPKGRRSVKSEEEDS